MTTNCFSRDLSARICSTLFLGPLSLLSRSPYCYSNRGANWISPPSPGGAEAHSVQVALNTVIDLIKIGFIDFPPVLLKCTGTGGEGSGLSSTPSPFFPTDFDLLPVTGTLQFVTFHCPYDPRFHRRRELGTRDLVDICFK